MRFGSTHLNLPQCFQMPRQLHHFWIRTLEIKAPNGNKWDILQTWLVGRFCWKILSETPNKWVHETITGYRKPGTASQVLAGEGALLSIIFANMHERLELRAMNYMNFSMDNVLESKSCSSIMRDFLYLHVRILFLNNSRPWLRDSLCALPMAYMSRLVIYYRVFTQMNQNDTVFPGQNSPVHVVHIPSIATGLTIPSGTKSLWSWRWSNAKNKSQSWE